jgi:hypothetical protein
MASHFSLCLSLSLCEDFSHGVVCSLAVTGLEQPRYWIQGPTECRDCFVSIARWQHQIRRRIQRNSSRGIQVTGRGAQNLRIRGRTVRKTDFNVRCVFLKVCNGTVTSDWRFQMRISSHHHDVHTSFTKIVGCFKIYWWTHLLLRLSLYQLALLLFPTSRWGHEHSLWTTNSDGGRRQPDTKIPWSLWHVGPI